MDKIDNIYKTFKKEKSSFDRRGFKFPYCPVHILLAGACGDCPAKALCSDGNPGDALGIDHQTLTKDREGNERLTFRPYKTSFDDKNRALLERYCEYFKLRLEVLDVNTYSEEVGGRTYTVHISCTDASQRFRPGGDVLGTPWYGRDSPTKRFKCSHCRSIVTSSMRNLSPMKKIEGSKK